MLIEIIHESGGVSFSHEGANNVFDDVIPVSPLLSVVGISPPKSYDARYEYY